MKVRYSCVCLQLAPIDVRCISLRMEREVHPKEDADSSGLQHQSSGTLADLHVIGSSFAAGEVMTGFSLFVANSRRFCYVVPIMMTIEHCVDSLMKYLTNNTTCYPQNSSGIGISSTIL